MQWLFILSLVAGALTVISPCVLPLLPVIVGSSIAGERSFHRAVVVTLSLGVSVFVFTFLLKVSTAFVMVPQSVWNYISGFILFIVGASFLFPTLWDRLPLMGTLYAGSNKVLGSGYQKQNLIGDIIVGAALGPVFSSCSPTYFIILANVLPISLSAGIADILAYTFGLCGFLLLVALIGQRIIDKMGFIANPTSPLRRGIGALFIGIALIIATGSQSKVEAPLYALFDETKVEQVLLSTFTSSKNTEVTASSTISLLSPEEKAMRYEKAPELVSPDGYINTDGKPISLKEYEGKNVVLVDFWDYSCINCQRTTPYLNAWYQKYKDQGLVIIGVHTPEFSFEHQLSNVEDATKRFGITYPVVLDNQYQTWGAYQNQYWPNEYLIDIDGYVVHTHAGEGEYDETEHAIQDALKERALRMETKATIATSTVNVSSADPSGVQSPETYFGSNRNSYFGNGTRGVSGVQTLTIPNQQLPNTLYLGGTWNITPEYAEAHPHAQITFTYGAHDVYMVATNKGAPVTIKIWRDGKLLEDVAGSDVDPHTSQAVIGEDRLYRLIHDTTLGVHTIKIEVEQGTLDAYTFTFG